jgi:hypothetical protein
MKNKNSVLTSTLVVGLSISLFACGNGKATNQENATGAHDHKAMTHAQQHPMSGESDMVMNEKIAVSVLIESYLEIKNALVLDDSKAASIAGQKLAESAKAFDAGSFESSKQTEINEILEIIEEHGEHIAKSEIDHQREHFQEMAGEFMDLLELTGTDRTLYQQFCPMYNNGKGGIWLSEFSEIKNPFYGNKMLTCGSTKSTIQ